ncbi:MAG TPA: ABC transporter permease subunit [Anaerolineales bacterium]|nr:ABC transporter permease subunit [Anaerolineales bacterium]
MPPQESRKARVTSATPVLSRLMSLLILIALDASVIWFLSRLVSLGYYPLAAAIFIILIFVNVVLLFRPARPIRWMVVGLALMALFTIYPILFTVWVSFTNYGEGHLITKEQAVNQILRAKYLAETGKAYSWTAFKSPEGDYALWLVDADGNGYLAKPGELPTQPQPGQAGIGELDERGIPKTIEGYQRLNAILAATDKNLTEILFGEAGKTIQIRSPSEAAELLPLYIYDPDQDAMISQETGIVYRNLRGTFTSPDGRSLRPGFVESVKFTNFRDFFISPALRGPLVRIILWNFGFAFFSLLLSFSLGLAIAILFNEESFPFKKLIRSLLIIPYTVPALITILIWRGMMNPELGVFDRILESTFGWAPPWFTDQWWAKIAILLVNLWLSYPYFMLICSGALQSISKDYYNAAQVDGASRWQQFWNITLPLLLVAVGPLLVASFTFNFNNFNLIYLFNQGNPPMAGTPTPAGHTDILISYVYNLAFTGSRGVNYGFASAITIVIFLIVGAITLFQFRFTNMWEEVSENL